MVGMPLGRKVIRQVAVADMKRNTSGRCGHLTLALVANSVPISGVDEAVTVSQGKGRSKSTAISARAVIVRVVCVVCVVAALGLAFNAAMDLSLTGFPDGHLTDYDKAVNAPKRILLWVEFGFALLFLVLALLPIGARARAIGLLVALIALVLVVTVQLVGVPWYLGTHLGLDNGIGG
jgi:hypothetical protein